MVKIGLDAGHGLHTAGKQTPTGIKEWTLNDSVRDKVVDMLKDYDVEFVNVDNDEGEIDEGLSSRVAKYKNAGVAAFVSIHHNAYTGTWNGATGVETYTDRKYTEADEKLAKCVHPRLVKYTGLTDRGIKRANFAVINQNAVPAILVEGGFMDGTEDYKVITSNAGQTAYAKAVAEGLIEFLNLQKKETTTQASTQPTVQPTVQAPATNATIKVGDVVSIKAGSKYYTGQDIPNWVEGKNWIVKKVNGDEIVIDKSEDGASSINSPVNAKDLVVVKKEQPVATTPSTTDSSFSVRVSISNLNIRKGPGTNYSKTGNCTGVGTFTIVEVKSGQGSDKGWGKLKSGAGWIALDYATRV